MSQSFHAISEAQLFLRDKHAWENAIATYKDNDPLELWFNYICWYDYNIHADTENKFQEVLEKCLSLFEHSEMYKQDVRMIKLWVKYIDLQSNPLNLYQILYQRGIGTQCSCFYIGWAHYYDYAHAFKQAESVYNLGFQAKAEPYNELQEAHTKFRLSVSQRMLYNDSSSKKRSANNLIEQRQQITALTLNPSVNSLMKKTKSVTDQSETFGDSISYSSHNTHTQANNNDEEQQQTYNTISSNEQCGSSSSSSVDTSSCPSSFSINDSEIKMSKCFDKQSTQQNNIDFMLENVRIPLNFAHYAKNNFETWKPTLFIEEPFELTKTCFYQKHLVYPGEGIEYSPEEIRSRKWIKRYQLNSRQADYLYHEQQQQKSLQIVGNVNDNEYNNVKSKMQYITHYSEEIQNNENKNVSQNENENYSETVDRSQINTVENHYDSTLQNFPNNTNREEFDQFSATSGNKVHCFQKNHPVVNSETIRMENQTFKGTFCCIQQQDGLNSQPSGNKMLHYVTMAMTPQTDFKQNDPPPLSGNNFTNLRLDHNNKFKNTFACNSTNINYTQTSFQNALQASHQHQKFTSLSKSDIQTARSNNFSESTVNQEQQIRENEKNYQYHLNENCKTTELPADKYCNHFSHINTVEDIKQNSYLNKSISEDVEDQIEASTIHFSTGANGTIKNKRITIKFRKEIPNNLNNLNSSKRLKLDKLEQNSSVQSKRKKHNYDLKGTDSHNTAGNCFSSLVETLEDIYSGYDGTDEKKSKQIKTVNNNFDEQQNKSPEINRNNYTKIKNAIATTTTPSRNQYEDASLLLSLSHTSYVVSESSSINPNENNGNGNASQEASDTFLSNDDSISNTEFNISFNESSNIATSNCSTPQQKLSQLNSKTSLTTTNSSNFRNLRHRTSNISFQNDDSVCFYEQNSFFETENDEELKQKRLSKALSTIEKHLAKPVVDPFNSELCKAFLTKLNFPSRDNNDVYNLVNTPISKLSNTKSIVLADITYNIEKEVGRGSYGSVYKAINTKTGMVVALKYQKPPNIWEVYICNEVRKRIKNYNLLTGFMNMSLAIIAPNASIIITDFSVYGSLLDINNKIRQATKKVMHESLAMHLGSQILDIVNHLHSCKIIHADIKPDNFLLMKVPNSDSPCPSLRLIDFGCAIDMTLFPGKMQFQKVIQTDGFTCTEMQEGRPWSYQTDLFCTAATIHVMLFGDYMQLIKKFDQWDIKQKLPRYLKKHVWSLFFTKMLNIRDDENLPNLIEIKEMFDNELKKMDSELQSQIRTLSNILHRR